MLSTLSTQSFGSNPTTSRLSLPYAPVPTPGTTSLLATSSSINSTAIFSEFEKRTVRLHREILMEREATLHAVRSAEKDFLVTADLWRQSVGASLDNWSSLCHSLVEEVRMTCDAASAQRQEEDRVARGMLSRISHEWVVESDVLRQEALLQSVDRVAAKVTDEKHCAQQAELSSQLAAALKLVDAERQRLADGWRQLDEGARRLERKASELQAQHDEETEALSLERARLVALRSTILKRITSGSNGGASSFSLSDTSGAIEQTPCAWAPPTVLLSNVAALAPRMAVSLDTAGVSCGWIRDVDGMQRLVVLAREPTTWTLNLPDPIDSHIRPYTGGVFHVACVCASSTNINNCGDDDVELLQAPVKGVVLPPLLLRGGGGGGGGAVVLSNVDIVVAETTTAELFITILPPPPPVQADTALYSPTPALIRVPIRVIVLPAVTSTTIHLAAHDRSFEDGAIPCPPGACIVTIGLRLPSTSTPLAYAQKWELRLHQRDGTAVLLTTTHIQKEDEGIRETEGEDVGGTSWSLRFFPVTVPCGDCELCVKFAGFDSSVRMAAFSLDNNEGSGTDAAAADECDVQQIDDDDDDESKDDEDVVLQPEEEASHSGHHSPTQQQSSAEQQQQQQDSSCSNSTGATNIHVWPNKHHRTWILQDVHSGELRETSEDLEQQQQHDSQSAEVMDARLRSAFIKGTLIPIRTVTPIAVWLPDGAECVCVIGVVDRRLSCSAGGPDEVKYSIMKKKPQQQQSHAGDDDDDESGGTTSRHPTVGDLEIVIYALDLEEIVATLQWPEGVADHPDGQHIGFARPPPRATQEVSAEASSSSPPFVLLFSSAFVVQVTLTDEWTARCVFEHTAHSSSTLMSDAADSCPNTIKHVEVVMAVTSTTESHYAARLTMSDSTTIEVAL